MVAGTRVGLTGGIASGKSTVGQLFADRGAVVIDADQLARDAVAVGSSGLAEVVARFGEGILQEDGSLDRPALGRIVFSDERARRDLEAIIHPRVRTGSLEGQQEAWDRGRIAIRMIPLLVETGQAGDFDELIVVDVPPEVQVQRLMARSGLTEDEAWARVRAQVPRDERLAAATIVIDNSGTPDQLEPQVERAWQRLQGGIR